MPKPRYFLEAIHLDRFRRRLNTGSVLRLSSSMRKYLSLSSLVGRNKRNTFNDIKEKVKKKLVGWKEKLLSKAGKEILIKVVAQAIPTYTMSCFKVPDSLCEELIGMIRNFCWGQR